MKSAKNLQKAWDDYGVDNFEFFILQVGNYLSNQNDSLYYEKRSINEHRDKNKGVYNKLYGKTLKELKVKQNRVRTKVTPLKPYHKKIHYFFLLSVYSIKNKFTDQKYVGENNSLIPQFLKK